MKAEIECQGGRLDGVLCCPHAPEENCTCRKPKPGLLLSAAEAHGLDLERCYLIGDALADIQAGQAVGCKTIMVMTGRGAAQHQMAIAANLNGFTVARDLEEAVEMVLRT
jgi:histidinol-phosphate phosphatase family protein